MELPGLGRCSDARAAARPCVVAARPLPYTQSPLSRRLAPSSEPNRVAGRALGAASNDSLRHWRALLRDLTS
jgi:hypothetical protein